MRTSISGLCSAVLFYSSVLTPLRYFVSVFAWFLYQGHSCWYILFHCLSVSLHLKYICFRQYVVGYYFLMYSDNLCLLIGMFSLFTVIIDMVSFISTVLLLPICPIFQTFPFNLVSPFLPSFCSVENILALRFNFSLRFSGTPLRVIFTVSLQIIIFILNKKPF